jgi:hypothetical protein
VGGSVARRAWRIQRLPYKIPALLFSGLLSLAFSVVVLVACVGCHGADLVPLPEQVTGVITAPPQGMTAE